MSRERLPSSHEIKRWISALGIREGNEVVIQSELRVHDGWDSSVISLGYYGGVTRDRKIKLYRPPNSWVGEKGSTVHITASTVNSIKKPELRPLDTSWRPRFGAL